MLQLLDNVQYGVILWVKDLKNPLHSGSRTVTRRDSGNLVADALHSCALGLSDGGIRKDPRPAVYGFFSSGKSFFVDLKISKKAPSNAKNTERA